MQIWLAVLLIVIIGCAAGAAGYLLGLKKGKEDRKNQILREYTSYVPLGRVIHMAEEMMEEDGMSEDFPMLIIKPDKYDYLEGEE